ncbi:MAG TPA: hypothetical protein VMY80_14010 [Anaerolineae bacterium]|nr:hypothetical protein [Anaerolineae bacterium]
METNWQVGFAHETIDVPGAVISGQQVGLAIVESVRGAILVRALETVQGKALDARLTHTVMDIGSRYDTAARVCGPSEPARCWNAPFVRCVPTVADLERLRELLATGTLRLPNGHESMRKAEKFVAPALPQEPPVAPFIEARSAILGGGAGGALGLALAAAVHGLEPIPDPPAAPAPMPGWRTTGTG